LKETKNHGKINKAKDESAEKSLHNNHSISDKRGKRIKYLRKKNDNTNLILHKEREGSNKFDGTSRSNKIFKKNKFNEEMCNGENKFFREKNPHSNIISSKIVARIF